MHLLQVPSTCPQLLQSSQHPATGWRTSHCVGATRVHNLPPFGRTELGGTQEKKELIQWKGLKWKQEINVRKRISLKEMWTEFINIIKCHLKTCMHTSLQIFIADYNIAIAVQLLTCNKHNVNFVPLYYTSFQHEMVECRFIYQRGCWPCHVHSI